MTWPHTWLASQSPEAPGERTQGTDSELQSLFLKGCKRALAHNSFIYLDGFHQWQETGSQLMSPLDSDRNSL